MGVDQSLTVIFNDLFATAKHKIECKQEWMDRERGLKGSSSYRLSQDIPAIEPGDVVRSEHSSVRRFLFLVIDDGVNIVLYEDFGGRVSFGLPDDIFRSMCAHDLRRVHASSLLVSLLLLAIKRKA